MKKRIVVPLLLSALMLGTTAGPTYAHAGAAPMLKKGMKNSDVWDLQFQLGTQGYLSVASTGYYGTLTEKAVQAFQREHGLAVDGVAGPNTLAKIKKSTIKKEDVDKLARVIHGEARGESFEGQVAVGAVVLNRLQSEEFPKTMQEVIFQPGAFTAVSDGQYALTPNKQAYRAAREALRGVDPTDRSLYYFNPDIATSKWIWTRQQIKKIGKHIFAK
ncbi:cell wall hydrolase [Aneurinibacillus sp. REN35]|uniref:cell wall hydrolase n=1 Tax=Aneurinibacillus sp. REN35 TaxID=3237286 RepID=UPI0035288C41